MATRKGRKEARKVRNRSFRSAWLTVIAAVGTLLLVTWWTGPRTDSEPGDQALSTEHLLAEYGIEFSVPSGWTEMAVEQPNPPRWTYAVSPDHGSNWILLTHVPNPEPGAMATQPGIGLLIEDLKRRSLRIMEGPAEVEFAGLQGFEVTIEGIVGSQTGKDLAGETVLLYAESDTYKFDAQWDTQHEADVRAGLDEILNSLRVK